MSASFPRIASVSSVASPPGEAPPVNEYGVSFGVAVPPAEAPLAGLFGPDTETAELFQRAFLVARLLPRVKKLPIGGVALDCPLCHSKKGLKVWPAQTFCEGGCSEREVARYLVEMKPDDPLQETDQVQHINKLLDTLSTFPPLPPGTRLTPPKRFWDDTVDSCSERKNKVPVPTPALFPNERTQETQETKERNAAPDFIHSFGERGENRKNGAPDFIHSFGEEPTEHAQPKGVSPDEEKWPLPLSEAAYHGLVGEIVRTIEPHTESDPAAVLLQFLVGFGNLVGRGNAAHFTVEGDKHYANLNVCLVGATAKGRKGTSWGQVRLVLEGLDPRWFKERVKSGLSSGEGLIAAVKDEETPEEDK